MSAFGDGTGPSDAGRPDPEVRAVGLITWLLSVGALVQLFWQSYNSGVLQISVRWQAALFLGTAAVAVAGVWLWRLRRTPVGEAVYGWGDRLGSLTRHRYLSLAMAVFVALLFPILVFGAPSRYVGALFPRLLIFWVASLLIAVLLRGWFPRTPRRLLLLGVMIAYGLFVRALAFVPELSTYPFSLGWSEASRYYYASLFRGEAIYGQAVQPPELHPTRYLLQAIPFLMTGWPLWFHRLWQTLLWWLLPVATAALLVARHRMAGRWTRLLVGGWIVLYLFQGPVYYHLLVTVVLVLAGLDVRRPWRSTAFIMAASIWAGLSRLNWYPVPGLLAACLYLVELDPGERPRGKAVRWPIAWVVLGTLAALISQAVYVDVTAIEVGRFTSSLSSDLLFYRLLPNATYALGILPAILMASAPMLLSLWWSRPAWLERVDAWRGGFLAAAGLVLAVGGLVVSLKIGGGSNLHNLDAFLVLLLLVGSSLLLRAAERTAEPAFHPSLPPFRQTALLVAIPLVFAVGAGGRWIERDFASAEKALDGIRNAAVEAAGRGERVLFISQRHLLTFGMVPEIPLEPEYETVFLMEMAMSGNRDYLDRFHSLLEEQAFGLIVVDRLSTARQGRSHNFGEENDAWVTEVSLPLLCSYEFSARFDRPPVDLLVPRADPTTCPE
jgi:hypothetical protein